MVADAFSSCHEEGSVAAIIAVIPKWCQQVIESYAGDEKVRELLEKVAVGSKGVEGYTLVDEMLRYQGQIVIGNNEDLRRRILAITTRVSIGGGGGTQGSRTLTYG